MKLQLLQENFAKALSLSSRFVSSKAQLPVLANVLLRATKTKLFLSATNLEISISTSIGAKGETDGSITIPARTLADIITNLPKGTLTLEGMNEQLKIQSENFEATLVGINSAEFPAIPDTVSSSGLNLNAEEFISSLSQVVFSASSDESRPVLTGVMFMGTGDNMLLVGTDGIRLSQRKLKLKDSTLLGKTIVPKAALLELGRLSQNEETIHIDIREAENQILFGLGDTVLSSRVIEGEFPPFERIIPKETRVKVKLNKDDLHRAVKVAGVFARDAGNMAKLFITNEGISIVAESSKSGNQKMNVEAKVEGESLEIMYNIRFIEEFLNVCKGEEIEIGLNDATSPGVFKDSADLDFLHLIMPAKLT